MRQRLVFFVTLTLGLAARDFAVKEWLPTSEWLLHERSSGWVGLSAALLVGCLAIAAISSRMVTAAAAITAGGTLGNLVSVGRYGGVPNPLLVGGANGIAFNVADVFVVGGLVIPCCRVGFGVGAQPNPVASTAQMGGGSHPVDA